MYFYSDFCLKKAHVPGVETSYWCQVVKVPIEEDRYIYKVNIL